MPIPNVGILITAKNKARGGVDAALGQLDRLRVGAGRLKDVLFSAQGILAGIGLGIGAAEVTRFFLDTNRQTQSLLAQLKVLEGSQAGAQRVFDAIQEFAQRTPFQVDEVAEAYIRLRTSGIMPTEEMLTEFGDLAAARGKTLKEFVEGVEDAVTGEFERMKEFGIKAKQNGDTVAMSFNGQTTIIRNTRDAIVEYLGELGRSDIVQGTMEEQMNTLNGTFSNLLDNLGTLARTIGDQGGVNDLIQAQADEVSNLTTEVNQNAEAVRDWTNLVVRLVLAAVQTIVMPVRVGVNAFTALLGIIGAIFTSFGWGISEAASLILRVAGKVMDVLGKNDLAKQLSDLADAQAAGAERMAEANRKMLASVSEDGRDTIDSVRNLGQSYRDLASAVLDFDRANTKAREHGALPGGDGNGGGGGGGDTLSKSDQKRLDTATADFASDYSYRRKFIGEIGPRKPPNLKPVRVEREQQGEVMKFALALHDALDTGQGLSNLLSDMTLNVLTGFGDAVSSAFEAFVTGSKSAGDAFKSAMLGAVAAVAKGLGNLYAGKAVAAIADGIALHDPSQFVAAAKYMAAATAMYALAGGLAGMASGGGGGGGAGSTASASSAAADTDRLSGKKGRATIVLKGSAWNAILSDPEAQDSFAELLHELDDRDYVLKRA